jgi:hypothetical protein
MKKAKIMLMVVAILAIVGASLAFKANRFIVHTLYYTTTSTGVCNNAIATFRTLSTTTTVLNQPKVFYTTTALNTTCAAIFTVPAQ